MKIQTIYSIILIAVFPFALLGNGLFPNSQGCPSTSNLALNKTAYQVSTFNNGIASRAVDGNTNGDFFASPPSVSHTNFETNGWWEVDLGDNFHIDSIEVWNQTGGNSLEQYYIFVSEHPFISYDLTTILTDTTIFKYHYDSNNYLVTNHVGVNINGRYVRVQRSGGGFVTLAELVVNGCEISPIQVSPSTCGANNGAITFDKNCTYLSYIWSDGNEELCRTNLASGNHSITITNKKGCNEELIFNVPDISSCNFNVQQNAILNDGMGSPCYEMVLNATTNGENIPFGSLDISWQIGGTNMDTVFSNEMSVELPIYTEWVTIDVSLVLPSGEVSCCTYSQNFVINDADNCVNEYPINLNQPEDNSNFISHTNKIPSLLKVTPNPFQDYLNLELQSTTEGITQIHVFDNLGRLIYSKNIFSAKEIQYHRIDFGNNNMDGLYLVRVQYPDAQVKTAKVIYTDGK